MAGEGAPRETSADILPFLRGRGGAERDKKSEMVFTEQPPKNLRQLASGELPVVTLDSFGATELYALNATANSLHCSFEVVRSGNMFSVVETPKKAA